MLFKVALCATTHVFIVKMKTVVFEIFFFINHKLMNLTHKIAVATYSTSLIDSNVNYLHKQNKMFCLLTNIADQ